MYQVTRMRLDGREYVRDFCCINDAEKYISRCKNRKQNYITTLYKLFAKYRLLITSYLNQPCA